MSYTLISIEKKLRDNFSPDILQVIDESHHHIGHAGYSSISISHIKIIIQSLELKAISKVAAHKAIYKVLEEEIKQGLHAISITINASIED